MSFKRNKMQSSQHYTKNSSLDSQLNSNKDSLVKSSSFSPFLARTLKSPGNDFEFVSYCQKKNTLITGSLNGKLKFYDATTLLPLEERKFPKLNGLTVDLAYDHENENFLIGRIPISVHIYDVSKDELKMLRKNDDFLTAIAFLEYPFYVFSIYRSRELYVGTFDKENVSKFKLESSEAISLCSLIEKKILLAGSDFGFVRIYRTDNLPKLRAVCSIQAHGSWISEVKVQRMSINGKEYMMTSSVLDRNIKIWHLIRGRMRLLRVIHLEGEIDSFVYLENYKMIAIACNDSNGIKFFNIFSGKLEKTFCFSKRAISSLFLMKDKNMIGGLSGVPGGNCDSVEFIQLHNPREQQEQTSGSGFLSRKIDEIKNFFKKL